MKKVLFTMVACLFAVSAMAVEVKKEEKKVVDAAKPAVVEVKKEEVKKVEVKKVEVKKAVKKAAKKAEVKAEEKKEEVKKEVK